MCLKKWFGKEEEVVEEVPVERKPVDELVQSINDLVAQLNLVIEDNKQLEQRIKGLEADVQGQCEETSRVNKRVEELMEEKAELQRRLDEIGDLAKGE